MRASVGLFLLLAGGCSEPLSQVPDDGGAPRVVCEAGSFCVEVRGTPPPMTRIGIAWSPLSAMVPPQIAWEMPLNNTTHVKVAIGQVAAPMPESTSCPRDCPDPAKCACKTMSGIGVGYAIAAVDTNTNGKIDLDANLSGDALVGAGFVVLGWAQEPIDPATCRDANAICTYALKHFPKGMPKGVAAYPVTRPEGGGLDLVGATAPLLEYPLDFCAGSPCTPNFPVIQ